MPFLLTIVCRICGIMTCLLLGSWDVRLSAEESWPQFRGPSGQGWAGNSQLPVEFNETKNITWKTALPGLGWSSAVLQGSEIWVTTATPPQTPGGPISLRAIGLETSSGKILKNVELFAIHSPEEIHLDNSYASPTPVIDETAVYCHFGTFGTAAVSRQTGEILWKNESLKIDHQGGPGSSPIAYRETLIVSCDGADHQYVAALSKQTGEILWRRVRTAPFRENPITHRSFATPLIWNYAGRDLLISPGADQVHAYDPATGEELWHVRYIGFSNVPAPVADREKVYVCTGFFEPYLIAIEPGGIGEVTKTHVPWHYNRSVSTIPSPIVVKDRIYTVNEGGILTCLDTQTGKVVRKRRFAGNYSASPIYAGGHLYFCSEDGKVTVLEPNDTLEIAQVNRLLGRIKASPTVAGNTLYLRTDTHLYRIEAASSKK